VIKALFKATYKQTIAAALLVSIIVSPAIFFVKPIEAEAAGAGGAAGSAGASASKCLGGLLFGYAASSTGKGLAAPIAVPVNLVGQVAVDGLNSGNAFADFVKNCVEHGIALALARLMLDIMTAQIVNWIDNGFDGNPAFVSDPQGFFKGIADGLIGEFILGSDLKFLCSPFKLQIKLALMLNYSYSSNFSLHARCTLTDVIKNINNFMTDFEQGGWIAWNSMTQNNQNNPYGAFLEADMELTSRVRQQQAQVSEKLSWGQGFLSYETCTPSTGAKSYTRYGGNYRYTQGGTTIDANGNTTKGGANIKPGEEYRVIHPDAGSIGGYYEDCTVNTPGSIIAGTLQNQLNVPAQQLGLADDLDKIVNALFNQLIQQVLGGAGGLLGSGRNNGSGSSFVSDMAGNPDKRLQDILNAANTNLKDATSQTGSNIDIGGGGGANSESQNIALQKIATASSVMQDHPMDGLTDGQKTNLFGGDYVGPMTHNESKPWMEVDLGNTRSIGSIAVYQGNHPSHNSTDGVHFKIQIYDKNKKLVWEGADHLQDFQSPIKENVLLNGRVVDGQYVRVQAVNTGVLEIAEVEIYPRNPPVITLKGQTEMTLNVGDSFVDPGATVKDDTDGNLAITKVGAVDTKTAGTYVLTYSATNSGGLQTTATRTVVVQ
jgi:hypothetical protein